MYGGKSRRELDQSPLFAARKAAILCVIKACGNPAADLRGLSPRAHSEKAIHSGSPSGPKPRGLRLA